MSAMPPFDPVREAALLSAYVDGELDAVNISRIESHLAVPGAESDATRQEIEHLQRLLAMTGALRLQEPPAEEWEVFWQDVAHRRERAFGWLLLGIGVAVCGAWGAWQLLAALWLSPELSGPVKVGAIVLLGGLAVLFTSVIRERIFRRSRSRYKDIIR